MKASDFVEKWNTDLLPMVKYNEKVLNQLGLPPDMVSELTQFGLPSSAAPSLDFEAPNTTNDMLITKKFRLSKKYDSFCYFGDTGEGDWICFDLVKKIFVVIRHEEGLDITYLNSSLSALYGSLECYYSFILKVNENDINAFRMRNIPLNLLEKLEFDLKMIDELAVSEKGFWGISIENLKL